MKINVLAIFFILVSVSIQAQEYPYYILPEKSVTINTENDTIWLLKDAQIKELVKANRKLEVCTEQLDLQKRKMALYEKREVETDTLSAFLKKDRDFYKTNWGQCSKDVEILGKKYEQQRLYTKLSLGGIAVAFIVGLLIR